MHASNSIIKFADDTTVVGLITNNDKMAYREEVRALGVWCQENNLTLNVNKNKQDKRGLMAAFVLSPLLYSLFFHDCVAMHASNSIIKFADDTTVVGLITNNNKMAYREEVRALGVWCQGKKTHIQHQQNKGDDRGLQETTEGAPPYPHRRDSSGEGSKF